MTRHSNKSRRVTRPRPKVVGALKRSFLEVPPVPRIFGYARVSTLEQSLGMQTSMLKASGCDRIFEDKISAAGRRPEYNLMRKHCQPGDTIKVYSLSRLFRDTKKLLILFDELKAERVELISLTERLDLKTSHGRMVATMLAAVDEMERGRVRERTTDGMAALKGQGVVFGRPRVVDDKQIKLMKAWRRQGMKVPAIARKIGCSAATVYNNT